MSKKKALIALARIMLVSIYHMIKKKEFYKELGANYLEQLNREKNAKRLKARIEALGYDVTLTVAQN